MENLTEEMKNDLVEFQNLNADMIVLINKIDREFRPLVDKACQEKDVMKLINLGYILPNCNLNDEIQAKIMNLTERSN